MVGASACQQQRLVADLGGRVPRRIDPHRPGERAAIAAAQEERRRARRLQQLADRNRGRRLAGAAEVEIADADDRYPAVAPGRGEAARRDRAVERGERREQRRRKASLPPPEGRLTHRLTVARGEAASDRDRARQASDRARRPARRRSAAPPPRRSRAAARSLSQAPIRTASRPASATSSAPRAASSAE